MSEVNTNRDKLNQRVSKGRMMEIDRAFLVRNPHQDRSDFSEEKIAEIASSMEQRIAEGLLPNAELIWVEALDTGEYEIISGETRDRAAESIGYDGPMNCLVYTDLSQQQKYDLMALANNGRNDLNLWEKARAVCRRLEDGQDRKHVMGLYGLNKSVLSRLEKLYKEAPDDVLQLARDRVRSDINTLLDLASLNDDARADAIQALRNGSLKSIELKEIVKDSKASDSSGSDTDGSMRKRRPTKLSLKAEQIRLVVEESPTIRKLIKEIIPGNGYKKAHGGELVEAFSQAIESLENGGPDGSSSAE